MKIDINLNTQKKKKVKKINLLPNILDDFSFKKKTDPLKKKYKNLLIIGNGGSISTTQAFLGTKPKKNYFILDTNEPRLIKELKKKFKPSNTIALVISKSGKTSTVIENFFAFSEYEKIIITTKNSPLWRISQDLKFEHPPVGGRFTGPTIVTQLPLYFLDFNIEKVLEGFKESYKSNQEENSKAAKIAQALYNLEKEGHTEIFIPIYSYYLKEFQCLISQLFHETICKEGVGQTVYCAIAPESQHHTNQRFFGGRKNVIGIFLTLKNTGKLKLPNITQEEFKEFSNLELSQALKYEFYGTYQNAINKKIPVLHIELSSLREKEIAKFIGFLHYLVIYSATLRNVDPFNQPAVEDSKKITIQLIKDKINL